MTKNFIEVFSLIIALSGAVLIFTVFGTLTYDKASSQKQKTITQVIDCRHVHSGRNGGYVVSFLLGQKIIEHHNSTQHHIGDSIYVKYYYSKMNGKLYIEDIQKKY